MSSNKSVRFFDNEYDGKRELKAVSVGREELLNGTGCWTNGDCVSRDELLVRRLLVDDFVPELKRVFKSRNPIEFARWQGNCCRQVAIFSAAILKEVLSGYTFEVKDYNFISNRFSQEYNHCFVIGKIDGFSDRGLLVDMERNPVYRNVFARVMVKDINFPHNSIEEFESESFCSEQTVITDEDVVRCLSSIKEFYTNRIGKRVVIDILKELKIKFIRDGEYKNFLDNLMNSINNRY